MKKSAKLQIRMSEIRTETNKLPAGEESVAKRTQLLAELDTVETEFRAAVEAEANDTGTEHRGGDGLTSEESESFRQLDGRAELRNVVRAVIGGEELSGAEQEIQRARGLAGTEVPWELVAPRMVRDRTEHRVDAVTASPTTANVNQRNPLGRVFARSCDAWRWACRCRAFRPATSMSRFLTAGGTASILAKDANIGDAAAGTIAAVTLSPKRLQSEYILREARTGRGCSGLTIFSASDLSMPRFPTCSTRRYWRAPAPGRTSAGSSRRRPMAACRPWRYRGRRSPTRRASRLSIAGVDGKYSGSVGECAMVVGDDTYRKLGTLINTGSGEVASMTFSRMLSRFMASGEHPGRRQQQCPGRDYREDSGAVRIRSVPCGRGCNSSSMKCRPRSESRDGSP